MTLGDTDLTQALKCRAWKHGYTFIENPSGQPAFRGGQGQGSRGGRGRGRGRGKGPEIPAWTTSMVKNDEESTPKETIIRANFTGQTDLEAFGPAFLYEEPEMFEEKMEIPIHTNSRVKYEPPEDEDDDEGYEQNDICYECGKNLRGEYQCKRCYGPNTYEDDLRNYEPSNKEDDIEIKCAFDQEAHDWLDKRFNNLVEGWEENLDGLQKEFVTLNENVLTGHSSTRKRIDDLIDNCEKDRDDTARDVEILTENMSELARRTQDILSQDDSHTEIDEIRKIKEEIVNHQNDNLQNIAIETKIEIKVEMEEVKEEFTIVLSGQFHTQFRTLAIFSPPISQSTPIHANPG